MKNSWKRNFALIMLFSAVAMFSITTTAAGLSTPQTYSTADDSIQIEAKYKKVSTNKITFNGNGGKIGSKKTVAINIKKGAKIKKLPATPKRTGYTFKGWYTQKSGGKKISVNTKPTKSLTYFAQWTKARTLNSEEKKLVGGWVTSYWGVTRVFVFRSDGTWVFSSTGSTANGDKSEVRWCGNYQAKNNKLYFTNVVSGSKTGPQFPIIFNKYDFGTKRSDETGTYQWCDDPNDGVCLRLSIIYSSDQHFSRAGTGEYSYLMQP